eukprot:TRINITY_DN50248_c0_g1_i2.p1 TRINITY_DN50248_c0_g1~~TRINITY_DN50248_c0_g1_i2.p1  ORF type:complete len:565 (-),score=107.97 TRINITY_DN50248_c0_g1_i2:293-1987(-)
MSYTAVSVLRQKPLPKRRAEPVLLTSCHVDPNSPRSSDRRSTAAPAALSARSVATRSTSDRRMTFSPLRTTRSMRSTPLAAAIGFGGGSRFSSEGGVLREASAAATPPCGLPGGLRQRRRSGSSPEQCALLRCESAIRRMQDVSQAVVCEQNHEGSAATALHRDVHLQAAGGDAGPMRLTSAADCLTTTPTPSYCPEALSPRPRLRPVEERALSWNSVVAAAASASAPAAALPPPVPQQFARNASPPSGFRFEQLVGIEALRKPLLPARALSPAREELELRVAASFSSPSLGQADDADIDSLQDIVQCAWQGCEDLARADMFAWIADFEYVQERSPRKSLQDVAVGSLLSACYEDEQRKLSKQPPESVASLEASSPAAPEDFRCSLRSISTMASVSDEAAAFAMSRACKPLRAATPQSEDTLQDSLREGLASITSAILSIASPTSASSWPGRASSGGGEEDDAGTISSGVGGMQTLLAASDAGADDVAWLDSAEENGTMPSSSTWRTSRPPPSKARGVSGLLHVVEPLCEEAGDEDCARCSEDEWEQEFLRRAAADETYRACEV